MKDRNNLRNLLISIFLKGFKKCEPFCFVDNDRYYGYFEPKIKAVLDNPKSLVLLNFTQGEIRTYGGPFTLKSEEKLKGWLIAQPPDKIFSFFVFQTYSGKGEAKKMLNHAWTLLDKPKQVFLQYPTRSTFKCAWSSLNKKARVSVEVTNLDIF